MDNRRPKNTGLVPQNFDPRDIWEDELAGLVSTEPLPRSYKTAGLLFEPQGAWPFCVSFATTKMVEHAIQDKTHVVVSLSQPHLFFNSGGTMTGSTFRGNLETARNRGCISYNKIPMPQDIWSLDRFAQYRSEALETPFNDAKTILGYIRVNPDRDSLKRAIMRYGMLLVGVAASGGYWGDKAKRPLNADDNHACLLVGWEEDGSWIIFDSLQPSADFNGYHTLHQTYDFFSVYAVTELPADWKEQRDEIRSEGFEYCLLHYGKPRNFEAEQRAAVKLLDELKRFNNQSILDAAGKFWTVACNMIVYGGYSISYTKWGRWYPGDIINFIYAYRRTGKLIFDPNKLRSEYT